MNPNQRKKLSVAAKTLEWRSQNQEIDTKTSLNQIDILHDELESAWQALMPQTPFRVHRIKMCA